MSLPGYVARIRELLGSEEIVVPGTAAIVRDDEGRILFVRHAFDGKWGLPDGIPELAESPAERVAEEAGLDVEPVRLLGAYAGPSFRIVYENGDKVAYLTLVFECRVVGGELRADGVETVDARFFSVEEATDGRLSEFARAVIERVVLEPRAFDYGSTRDSSPRS